jgi:hypothetical protein
MIAYSIAWTCVSWRLRAPKLFTLRSDPFERANYEAGDFVKWFVEHAFVFVPAQALVAQHLATYTQFSAAPETGKLLDRAIHGETREASVHH